MFEKRALGKRKEVTENCNKLHNGILTLTKSYWSGRIKTDKRDGALTRMVEKRNAYRILVTKPAGKKPLGRLRRRWENNINIDSKEIRRDAMDSTHLAEDRNMWGRRRGGGLF